MQLLLKKAIQISFDFSIIDGHRDEAAQNEAYESGVSQVQWPNSKHNTLPSRAVDIAPYPINWKDTNRFYYLQGIIKAVAHYERIKIRQGCDWNGDGQTQNQKFHDLPHVELDTTEE